MMLSFSMTASFGSAARAIKSEVEALAANAHLAKVYVCDTEKGPGQADHDLLQAARWLEIAARDLRTLHARVESLRQDRAEPPHMMAAE